MPSAATAVTAAIVSVVCQANDHDFGGLGGFSELCDFDVFFGDFERFWHIHMNIPMSNGLRPVCLLAFRIIPSCLLLATSTANVATHGRCIEVEGLTALTDDDALIEVMKSINNSRYIESVLKEWREEVFFLEMGFEQKSTRELDLCRLIFYIRSQATDNRPGVASLYYLSGVARFWSKPCYGKYNWLYKQRDTFFEPIYTNRRFQKTQAGILRIRQHSNESLRDYLGRFGKETLYMTDHLDGD
ncbi:gag protein [Tanacetum coccineum]